MSVAAEAFAVEQTIEGTDVKILLQRFSDYLETLGTQPVTIPISNLAEDMLETFKLASSRASEVHTFAWAQSADLRATLEEFIETRECFFYTDAFLPAVEATFGRPSRQSEDELTVEIHYTWNPPMVNFKTFQNVFDENRSFYLEPKISQPCRGCETVYSVEQSFPIVKWNASEGCLEGYCPPLLASSMGAERLECFSMPLNMNAQVTTSFPGEMTLERTIRIEIPITIRRRPDSCGSEQELEASLAVRKPAVSVLIPSTNTTPQSAEARRPGKDVENENTRMSYKDINVLMDRKARAASGILSSPLRLNPLSLAQLWDATAPTPGAKEVQCWTVGISRRSSPVQRKTPSRRPPRVGSGSQEKPSNMVQTTTPTRDHQRVLRGRVEKSPNKAQHQTPAGRSPRMLQSCLKQKSAMQEGTDYGQPGPTSGPCIPSPETRVDSPVVPPRASASKGFSLSQEQFRFFLDRIARASRSRRAAGASLPNREKSSSPDRLKEWRKAPEQLSEAEKDALQRAIQVAHQKDLEEMEEDQEDADESMLVEGDEDSLASEF